MTVAPIENDAAEDAVEVEALVEAETPAKGAAPTTRRPRTPVDPEILALWDSYKASGNKDERDRLLLNYAPLVKYVAGREGSKLPPTIETGDLVSYGMFGLIDAIEKFEPSRGLKFETYAVARIRGAIIDELRSIDWVPRSVRTKARDVDRVFQALEVELSRTPTEAEIAARMGIGVEDLRAITTQVSTTHVVALDELMHRGGDGDDAAVTLGDRLTDTRVEQPGEALEAEQSKQALTEAIEALPARDRIVISLYYYEHLTLAEIGQVLGVTESRVCQLHTKATLALRNSLSSFGDAA